MQVVQCHAYVDTNITKQQSELYSKPICQLFWSFTQAHWQVTGQLQLHCLSMLNAQFIPCVCTFTYLSSLIIFTADTSSSSRPCCSVINHAHEHVNISTRMHGAFQGIHGSRGTRVRQTRGKMLDIYTYIHTYIHTCAGCCHDQCGARSGSPQLVVCNDNVDRTVCEVHKLVIDVVKINWFMITCAICSLLCCVEINLVLAAF